MAILSCGIIFHLADLALLVGQVIQFGLEHSKPSRVASTLEMWKTGEGRCAEKKKPGLSNFAGQLNINLNFLCADIYRRGALRLKKSIICRTSLSHALIKAIKS